jgi:hypothetical protein
MQQTILLLQENHWKAAVVQELPCPIWPFPARGAHYSRNISANE